jgi:hypothetical protein
MEGPRRAIILNIENMGPSWEGVGVRRQLPAVCTENSIRAHVGFKLIWKATIAAWVKCTNTKHEVVYISLDNAVTVTRNDVADLIAGRGTVISLMGGEQVYITVNEQPEEIMLFWCAT